MSKPPILLKVAQSIKVERADHEARHQVFAVSKISTRAGLRNDEAELDFGMLLWC